jgi:nucleoside-diphosphate-sugar epimerase
MSKVLVTGGSGFVGSHCILQLLAGGHEVRTSVRNLSREGDVRVLLKQGGYAGPAERLTFAAADLEADAGWPEAVAGCDYVLHVASPFPATIPKDENDLIRPAREGSLRVLRAARDAGVKRVVLTSSFAAIGYGHKQQDAPFNETDWTDLSGAVYVPPYQKSKTLAERAAWDFIDTEGGGLELAVVNPVGIFGPALAADYSFSILIIQRLVDGDVPGCPRISTGCVDVRDVADLHLRAMSDPAAKGERFLGVAEDFVSLLGIAQMLRAGMGPLGTRTPTRELPDWLVRLVGMVDGQIAQVVPELGKAKNATNEKARRLLGWAPRSNAESVVATAQSLQALGLLKHGARQTA